MGDEQDIAEQLVLQTQLNRFAAITLTSDGRELCDADGRKISAGARVALFGLVTRPDLNEKNGRVTSYDEQRARFAVELEIQEYDAKTGILRFAWSEKHILIKRGNLRIAARMPAAISTAAGSRRADALNGQFVLDWLDQGGDIEARDPIHNDTVLTMAALTGQIDLLGELLRRSANVDAQARNGTTALMYAATGHDHTGDVVRMLCNASASIGLVNSFGEDAFHMAQAAGRDDVVSVLREYGVTTSIQPKTVHISGGPLRGASDAATIPMNEGGVPDDAADIRAQADKLKQLADVPYAQLISRAMEAAAAGDWILCKTLSTAAIEIDPGWFTAHVILADVHRSSGDFIGALSAHLKAADLTAPGSEADLQSQTTAMMHARLIALAYFDVVAIDDDKLPLLPSWMTDRALLREKAAGVVKANPNEEMTHKMLASAHTAQTPEKSVASRCKQCDALTILPFSTRRCARKRARAPLLEPRRVAKRRDHSEGLTRVCQVVAACRRAQRLCREHAHL